MKYSDKSEIFKIETDHKIPTRGECLIAEPFLSDEPFGRSVVMMIDHTAEGSMGIITNKRLPILVNDVVKEFQYLNDIPLFCGGPLGEDMLFFLHSIPEISDAVQLSKNLYFNGNFTELKRYILQGNPFEGKIRFFLGYSGWAAGQLQQEIEENTWVIGRLLSEQLLQERHSQLWHNAMHSLGDKYQTWARFPQIPSLN